MFRRRAKNSRPKFDTFDTGTAYGEKSLVATRFNILILNTALLKDAVKIVNHALRQMDILCGCLIRIYGIEPLALRQQLHQMKLQ